jgi:NAD(P)-dependent dehydrogenase (short-subunit alcohol dehydrogenase family)
MTPARADLSGKVAVVTGGSRGIGAAIARAFAGAGSSVVIASRKLEQCRSVAAAMEAETGSRVLAMACHVGYWEQCSALVNAVYDELGRCDILVNNAGMSPLYGSLPEVTEAYWDKVTAVNLKGPFRLATMVGARRRCDSQHQFHRVAATRW